MAGCSSPPKQSISTAAEEVGWTWMRYDFHNVKRTPNTYYNVDILTKIRTTLLRNGGEDLLDRFKDGCFGHFLRWKKGRSSGIATHALMTRQIRMHGADNHEAWFRIGGKNIRFGPKEYALVTGLKFGPSTFDPQSFRNPTGVETYRRFCNGRPTTVKSLAQRFIASNENVADGDVLIKVANILLVCYFLFGSDDRREVWPWLWVLVDDLDAWRGFPWGAYTFKLLMHYVYSLNMKHDRLKYHFYGPVWALGVWSVEAIPELGHAMAKRVDPSALPRCLRWTMRPLLGGRKGEIFHDAHCFAELAPDSVERVTSYWLSLSELNYLADNFATPCNPVMAGREELVAASRAGKRMLDGRVDSHRHMKSMKPTICRPNEGGSSAPSCSEEKRFTKEFRDMVVAMVKDEVKSVMQQIVAEKEPQHFARPMKIILSQTQKSAGATVNSETRHTDTSLPSSRPKPESEKSYLTFRMRGDDDVVYALGLRRFPMTQTFFDTIEDPDGSFTDKIMNMYLLVRQKNLISGKKLAPDVSSDNTILVPVSFLDHMRNAWSKVHPDDPHCRVERNRWEYNEWSLPKNLSDIVNGVSYSRPWHNARHVISVCNVDGSHWVTIRIDLHRWEVELYDSLAPTVSVTPHNIRLRQLLPILRLLPRVLSFAGYWSHQSRPQTEKERYDMKLVLAPKDVQLHQFKPFRSGVYATMYVDRLVQGKRFRTVDEALLREQRKKICYEIFDMAK